jgi:C1A family cysteine protease
MVMNIKNYGWRPDKPDIRDEKYLYRKLFYKETELPPTVDLRSELPDPFDQGDLGSCTGNALAGAMASIHNKLLLSRLFIYYQERVIENDVDQDAGAEIRDGVSALASLGAPPETDWPYVESTFTNPPSATAIKDALQYKISSYHRVLNWNECKHSLASGNPVSFGFTVYDNFESDFVTNSGYLGMPDENKNYTVGGHAILLVGYGKISDFASANLITQYKLNPNEEVGLIRNSWSKDWGPLFGHFMMPVPYISNTNLSDDFWVLIK